MAGIQNNTQSSSTKWVIEVYPFGSSTPGASDFASSLTPPITLVSSPALETDMNNIIQGISFGNQSPEFTGPTGAVVSKSFGLQSLQISRDKSRPDASCTFSMVGPLSGAFVAGNWIIVSSAQGDSNSGGMRTSVKFIGQIESIGVSYTSTPDGNIVINSTIEIREWSTLLTSKLLFDFRSVNALVLQNASAGGGSLGAVTAIQNELTSLTNGANSAEEIKKLSSLMKDSFEPFETAHVILRLMGMIASNDTLARATKASEFFHQTALTPPRIPPSVLERLGVSAPESQTSSIIASAGATQVLAGELQAGVNTSVQQAQTPWMGGFVRVVTGIQPPTVFAKGDWNGVFNGQEDQTIDTYLETVKSNYKKRPLKVRAQSVLMNLQSQFTAWQLLNYYCEPVVNEVFTDIWHEYKDGDTAGQIVAKPVIVIRDKPFMMREIVQDEDGNFPFTHADAKDVIKANWTFYDDLPRIRINGASIAQFRATNTFLTSPNYILVNFTSPIFDKDMSFASSAIKSGIRLAPEQDRFGGQEYFAEAQFLGPDLNVSEASGDAGESSNIPNSSFLSWFSIITELSRVWYSYQYRMGNGTITLKDDNYALSVGFNAQFRVGYFDLVGHIDGISTNFTVEEDGNEITNTEVKISRIVYQPGSNGNDNNSLRLLPPDAWGRMFDPEFAEAANGVSAIIPENPGLGSFTGDIFNNIPGLS